MLRSFCPTGFVVKDLDASARFYSDMLGIQTGERFKRQANSSSRSWHFTEPI